jgi:hypothetical protein
MHRTPRLLSMLVSPLVLATFIWSAAPGPPQTAIIVIPATNTSAGGEAVGDAGVVYALSDPLLQPHRPTYGQPFTNLVTHVFLVRFKETGRHLTLTTPRQIFTGPRGMGIYPHAMPADWLIYVQIAPNIPSAPWTLYARHLPTGRVVVLDSSRREGLPSLVSRSQSDGRTVVWQTWTMVHGQPTSVIRSYDLVTGQRRVVAEGGTPSTWSYAWPAVSGRTVVFEKDIFGSASRAQIMVADLRTGRIRALTPAAAANSEPSIAGNIVAWKVGWRFDIGRAVVAYNLRTGLQRRVFRGPIEQPQVLTGGQLVFPVGTGPWRIQLYDLATKRSRTLATGQPRADGYAPGNLVEVGGRTVAYGLAKPSTTTTPNPTRLVIARLP